VAFGELRRPWTRFPEATAILTKPNADAGGRAIAGLAEQWAASRPGTRRCVTSLGQLRYLSLVRLADAVLGNSSSGIVEAPALKVATVNIGCRQDGRLRAAPSSTATEQRDTIETTLRQALSVDPASSP